MDITPSLIQDLGLLKDLNGKIVEQKLLVSKSKYSDKVDCHRIMYISDGLEVVGFVLKPKAKNSKSPVIIFNRGGNREYFKITEKTLAYLSFLSANNYVVIASQYRGNDGVLHGRDEFGGKDVNDVLNLIPLAKSLPFTESNKIVMIGYSRGGMMTYLAIKHGADIKAAAVVSGFTDIEQTYNEREERMKTVIRELVGMDIKEWKKRSAYYWSEKIDVPVLILHGDADWRVNVSQSKKLSKKLNDEGKPHKLIVFPQGNHDLGPPHTKTRDRLIFEWFNKYLQ